MMPAKKFDNQSYGKDNKWVLYNSTFRGGVQIGHIYSIAQSMNVHVIPNDNQGLVVGVGLPDRRKDFPPYDEKLAMQDADYQQVYRDIVRRSIEPDEELSFFRRLYEVNKAMRGRLPMLKHAEDIIGSDEVGFSPIPFDMTMVVPKFSHVIYPNKYDQFFEFDYSGQFEPPTKDIANQYVFMPRRGDDQDGWMTGRLKQKLAKRRNIQVTAVHEDSVPELVRCTKDKRLLSPAMRIGFENRYDNMVFEVALLPNTSLDTGHKHLIYETLSAATGKANEAVFAIPYRRMPQKRDDYGSPFRRALAVRDHINGEFVDSEPDLLDNVHITFVETNDNGRFEISPSTANYLPKKLTLHRYKQMWTELPALAAFDLGELGLDHLADFG